MAQPPDLAKTYDFALPDFGAARDLAQPGDLATRDFALAGDLAAADLAGGAADLEVNYCIVQFPATAMAAAGQPSPNLYGRIYQAGLTDASNQPAAGILGQVGWGALGSDPRAGGWSFGPAAPNAGYDFSQNNDEYVATITVAQRGTYGYVYRFSVTGGAGWTYCDTVGNGSNNGLAPFDPAKAGTLTVN